MEPGAEQGRFSGGNASVVLNDVGTFPFFCEIHPQAMRGELVVKDVEITPAAAPTTTAKPRDNARADIVDFAFDAPERVTGRNASVSWRNRGAVAHTVTFDDVSLDTGPIEPGEVRSVTAPERPGTYSYYCSLHPARMRGVLTVVAGAPPGRPSGGREDANVGGAGTLLAYGLAVLFLGSGAVGSVLGLRRR